MVAGRRRARAPAPGVEEEEAAGAVGVLGAAGLEAGLAEERRLLVAGHPGDRDLAAELGRGPEDAGEGSGSGSRPGRPEQVAELLVPAAAMDVEEHRPRGVRVIGRVAAGELEGQPGVDRPEATARSRPLDVARQPLDLGAGEVGVEDQPGALADQPLVAGRAQLVAAAGGRRSCQTSARCSGSPVAAVPGDDGLALVGDPDRVELRALDPGGGDRLARRRAASPPRSPRRRARPSRAEGSAGSNSE